MTQSDSARAWIGFRGSDAQRMIHDFLVSEKERARTRLETADASDVARLQADAAASTRLLAFIHSHDTPDIAKTYA